MRAKPYGFFSRPPLTPAGAPGRRPRREAAADAAVSGSGAQAAGTELSAPAIRLKGVKGPQAPALFASGGVYAASERPCVARPSLYGALTAPTAQARSVILEKRGEATFSKRLSHGLEEILQPLGFGRTKDGLGGAFLGDDAPVHEDDPAGDLPGKAHLVGDDDHGHVLLGQAADG